MDEKIKFIEEIKIKHAIEEQNKLAPEGQSNPIKASFMKFVNFKQKNKLGPKDLF